MSWEEERKEPVSNLVCEEAWSAQSRAGLGICGPEENSTATVGNQAG